MKPIARSIRVSCVIGHTIASLLCLTGLFCLAGCGGSSSSNTGAPPPPTLSPSKLCPHILGVPNNTAGATILGGCPRVAKWIVPASGIDVAISSYKSHCPGGIVVLRVFISPSMAAYSAANDPAASANDFWSKMTSQSLNAAGPANQIDWLEGPNELDNLPNWYNDLTAANWVASFWSALADLMHNAGYNPLVGSLVAGQPSPVTSLRRSQQR